MRVFFKEESEYFLHLIGVFSWAEVVSYKAVQYRRPENYGSPNFLNLAGPIKRFYLGAEYFALPYAALIVSFSGVILLRGTLLILYL